MHSLDKIQLFLDLRSKGNCLAYISSAIDVPVSTLGDWNRRYVLEIDASRAAKWESAEQSLQFNPEADLIRISQRIHACEKELDRRPIARMRVRELVRVISLWRREYFRRRNLLLAPIERSCRSVSVTPDVRRGLTSQSADGAHDSVEQIAQPESEPKPEISGNQNLVTPEVTRGLTSQSTSEHPTTLPADAASDVREQPCPPPPATDPESESKPEKTGIPDLASEVGLGDSAPSSFDIHSALDIRHSSFGHPASAAALFSLDNLIPLPAPWRPSDFAIYPLTRAAATLNHSNSKKTMIASSV